MRDETKGGVCALDKMEGGVRAYPTARVSVTCVCVREIEEVCVRARARAS